MSPLRDCRRKGLAALHLGPQGRVSDLHEVPAVDIGAQSQVREAHMASPVADNSGRTHLPGADNRSGRTMAEEDK